MQGTYKQFVLALDVVHNVFVAVLLLKPKEEDSHRIAAALKHEADVIRYLNDQKVKGVPKLYGVTQLSSRAQAGALYMQFLPGGDLFTHLENNPLLSKEMRKSFVKQIISIMKSVHAKDTVHRDIKLENIVLDDEQKLYFVDWGGSTLPNAPDAQRLHTVGTLKYLSPEKITEKEVPGSLLDLDKAQDHYAAAVSIYLILYGEWPRPGETKEELTAWHQNSKSSNKWEYIEPLITKGAISVLKEWDSSLFKLLNCDPEHRIKYLDEMDKQLTPKEAP